MPRHLGVKRHVRARKDRTPDGPNGSIRNVENSDKLHGGGGLREVEGHAGSRTRESRGRRTGGRASRGGGGRGGGTGRGRARARERKRAYDIGAMLQRIRAAVRRYPKAALFELAREGYDTVFEQLVACIISTRTRDEAMLEVSRRLFARARTPAAVAELRPSELEAMLHGSTFRERKWHQIREIARVVASEHGGTLPCDEAVLRSFSGVGPKCANLVLGIACGEPRVAVDVHVHRVTNRWGYVRTRSPERTAAVLEEKVPRRYRVQLNELLVPFGKHICTRVRPRCSTCPVLEYCRQVGVTEHR